MKKLTEKDAIWCKTQKQWDAIIEKLKIKKTSSDKFKIHVKESVLFSDGQYGDLSWARENNYTIHKAKDILKKSKIKELKSQIISNEQDIFDVAVAQSLLEKRVSKIENPIELLEKLLSEVTPEESLKIRKGMISLALKGQPLKLDFPTKELEELPEKWCVRATKENTIWFKDKGYTLETSDNNFNKNNYYHWPSLAFGISSHIIASGYTEITFDQFKKWVLNKEDSKTIEIEGIKNLSIREVQVKVSSQEEANECAEIAKDCGEKVKESFNRYIDEDCCTFRMDTGDLKFGVWVDEVSGFKTISIQEFRGRFGKKQETEIDWSKAGQLVVQQDGIVVITSGIHCEERNTFAGTAPTKRRGYSDDWNKLAFKLCTEPITLKNE